MKAGWEEVLKDTSMDGGNGGTFLKLSDNGDKFEGVFLSSKPYKRRIVWCEGKPLLADTDAGQLAIDEGNRASTRVAVAVYLPSEKAVKVWDVSPTTFQVLYGFLSEIDQDSWLVTAKRVGAKGDPKTTYVFTQKAQLNEDQKRAVQNMELPDLEELCNSVGKSAADDRLPF